MPSRKVLFGAPAGLMRGNILLSRLPESDRLGRLYSRLLSLRALSLYRVDAFK
jgi:hypothetical protein